ncbi:MAG: sulfatase [Candidatus Aminicenantes bacterium]|nr:sulfatase [Candidatus Aminicenantes bacterium]
MQTKKYSYLVYPVFFLLLIFGSTHCHQNRKIVKNIILITLDTLRADHVSAYGNEYAETPNIDILAESGIIFDTCYSPIPITLPAHASLFHSLPPHELKVYNNGQILPEIKPSPSLASVFNQKGYDTAAFVSLGVLKSHFRLNSGFDVYDDKFPEERWYLTASEINKKVFSWLDQPHPKPFFLWIHYSDPHDPYAPPTLAHDFRIDLNGRVHSEFCLQKREIITCEFELIPGENTIDLVSLNEFPVPRDDYRISLNDFEPEDSDCLKVMYRNLTFYHQGDRQSAFIKKTGQIKIFNSGSKMKWILRFQGNINLFPSEMSEGYINEVKYLDSEIGKLTEHLRETGLLENSTIVLVGDHGEGLGEHYSELGERYFGHIHYLYTFHTRIPLIISDTSFKSTPLRITEPATLMDIAPTLLKWTDLSIPSAFKGKDLMDLKSSLPTTDVLFFETYSPEAVADRFGLQSYPWLLIYTPGGMIYELYDLQKDPKQQNNIYPSFQDNILIRELTQKLNTRVRNILATKTEVEFDQNSREILRSLGYIK